MSQQNNPFLPSDRAVDKQAGTDIQQKDSREHLERERAELSRKSKNIHTPSAGEDVTHDEKP